MIVKVSNPEGRAILLPSGRLIRFWGPFTTHPEHVEIEEISSPSLSASELVELAAELVRLAAELRHGREAITTKG